MNLEFLLRLRDLASTALNKFGSTAQTVFNKVQSHVGRTASRNKLLSSSFDEIQQRIKQTEQVISRSKIPSEIRAARRELEQLQRMANRHSGNLGAGKATGGGGGGMMGLGGMVRGALPLALIAGALSLGTTAISDGLQAQARSKSFEVMAGKKEGGQLNKDLTKFAQDSIYGNEVFQNAQTMMGFGAAAKEVMPDLKMLGDIAMGDANKLGALTLAFSQTRAAGKLTGNDLLQFVNAGFNPLQIISEKTGESIGSLKEKMSQGLITFDMVKGAFQAATSEGGRFYNMTNEIAKTDFGKVQAFKGQLEGLSVQIGGMLAPAIGFLIENFLSPLLTKLSEVAQFLQTNLFPLFENFPIKDIFSNMLQAIMDMVTALLPVFDALKPAFITLFELVGPIFNRFFEFASFVAVRLGPTLTNLARIFSALIVPILKIAAALIMMLMDLFTKLLDWVTPVLEWITGMLAGLAEKLGVLLDIDPKTAEQNKANKVTVSQLQKTSQSDTVATAKASADIFSNMKNTGGTGGGEDTVKGVTSGGPRVININGVRFADKIEIHANTFEKGMDSVKEQLDEYLLRILYSGANLQG